MRTFTPFLLSLLLHAVPAQTVHLVGPGGLPQIVDALAIAQPGDVIVVQPGTYAHFTVNAGVTIRAQVPGTVNIEVTAAFVSPACLANPFCYLEGPTRFTVPPGQTAYVTGLSFRGNSIANGFGSLRHRVTVTGGTVCFDQCTIAATDITALTVTAAAVWLQDCSVGSSSLNMTAHGCDAQDSRVVAISSTFTGASPFLIIAGPGEGLRLTRSVLHGSRCTLRGGMTMNSGPGGVGLRATGGEVWLSDSTVTGGFSTTCAMDTGNAIGRLDRCTLGPVTAGCNQPPMGFLLGVQRPQAPQAGQPFVLNWRTQPNTFVGVLISFTLADQRLPILEQPWSGPVDAFTAGLFFADATGFATGSWNIPAPAWVNVPIWFHSIGGMSFPLQVGPSAGGLMR